MVVLTVNTSELQRWMNSRIKQPHLQSGTGAGTGGVAGADD